MLNKGYDHPLHSLDLLPMGADLPDGPRYTFPWANDTRLVIRPELRRRAEDLTTTTVAQAVDEALGYHAVAVAGFAEHDLGEDWAESMVYWTGRLLDADQERLTWDALGREQGHLLGGLLARGRRLWVRLALAVRLGGIDVAMVPARGRAPRAVLTFIDALQQAGRAAREPVWAARLAAAGFGPLQQADLADVVARLDAARLERIAHEDVMQVTAGRVVVLRGALMGDLSRLCVVAPHVLLPEQARALTVRRLLPRRSRPAQDGAPGATDLEQVRDPAGASVAAP